MKINIVNVDDTHLDLYQNMYFLAPSSLTGKILHSLSAMLAVTKMLHYSGFTIFTLEVIRVLLSTHG